MKKKVKSHWLILIILCAALLTIGAVLLFFSFFAVFKVYEVKLAIDVTDKSAFNVDTDFVNFGKAAPGNSNTRTIVLAHDYRNPLLMHFVSSGNISRFISLPDDFYLSPSLSRELSLTAVIPKDAQEGHYEGKLTVYFRRI